MNSIIRNTILRNFREGVSVEDIATSLGYTVLQIEKVVYPNGKERKELPPNIVRKKHAKTVIKEWESAQRTKKHQEELKREDDNKKKKWADAGRKSWETRRLKAMALQEPTEQPEPEIRSDTTMLVTIDELAIEKAIQLMQEAVEYIEVGFDCIRRAKELLKK